MGATGLGNLLVKEGLLTEQDRLTIAKTCGQSSWAFAKCVLSMGMLDEDELAAFFAERTKFQVAPRDLLDDIDPDILAKIDARMVARLEVLPIKADWEQIQVAVCDPLDKGALRQLEFFTGLEVDPLIAPLSVIYEGLSRLIPGFIPHDPALASFLQNHAATSWQKQRIEEEGLLTQTNNLIQEDNIDDDDLESDVDELYDADGTADIEDDLGDLEDLGEDLDDSDFPDADPNDMDSDDWDEPQTSESPATSSEDDVDLESFESDLDELSFEDSPASAAPKESSPSIDELDFEENETSKDDLLAEPGEPTQTSEQQQVDDFFIEGLTEDPSLDLTSSGSNDANEDLLTTDNDGEDFFADSPEDGTKSNPNPPTDEPMLDEAMTLEGMEDFEIGETNEMPATPKESEGFEDDPLSLKTAEAQKLSDLESSDPIEDSDSFMDEEPGDYDPSLAETVEPSRLDQAAESGPDKDINELDDDLLQATDGDDEVPDKNPDDDLIDSLFEDEAKDSESEDKDEDEDSFFDKQLDASTNTINQHSPVNDELKEPPELDQLQNDIPINLSKQSSNGSENANRSPKMMRASARRAPSRPVSELNQAMLRLSLATSAEKALEIARQTLSQIGQSGFIAYSNDGHDYQLQTSWRPGASAADEQPDWFSKALRQSSQQPPGHWMELDIGMSDADKQFARTIAYSIPGLTKTTIVVISSDIKPSEVDGSVLNSAKEFLDLLGRRL